MKASDLIKGKYYVDREYPDDVYEYMGPSKAFAGEHFFETICVRRPSIVTPDQVVTDITEYKGEIK